MTVKYLITSCTRRLTTMLGLILIAGAAIPACDSKNSTSDEAQVNVATGNTSLERMSQIDTDLRGRGISIKYPALSAANISNQKPEDLAALRDSVKEFIEHGNKVLKISERPDVSFSDKQKVTDWLSGADRLLFLIEEQIQGKRPTPPVSEESQLWATWHACNDWVPKNNRRYGIVFVLKNSDTVGPEPLQTPFLNRLGRQRRRQVKKLMERHIECLINEEAVAAKRNGQLFDLSTAPASPARERLETALKQLAATL